jgi:phage terminase large subunit
MKVRLTKPTRRAQKKRSAPARVTGKASGVRVFPNVDAVADELIATSPETLDRMLDQLEVEDSLDQLRNAIPPVFSSLFRPARYKGAYGGRGSAKSWSFAEMVVHRTIQRPGSRVVCIREFQRSLSQSVKRLLEDTITRYKVGSRFRVLNTFIETPGDGRIIFQGMQDHTAESIKSLEGFDLAWVEEAQVLSQRSLDLLRPTLRRDDSELWFTWNPRHENDPVDNFLRNNAPPGSIVVKANYADNPHLPKVLRDELEWDRRRDPEKYEHIWLGEYEKNSEARVFKNWRIEDFDTPPEAEFLFGGDWGFATDPTVLVRGFVNGRTMYIDAEVYRVGCDIDDTPALFDQLGCQLDHVHDIDIDRAHRSWEKPTCQAMGRAWELVTDSARPETISYMTRHGYPRIIGAKKGPGSIEEGIQFLKSYDLVVHSRCRHVADELTAYSFKKNKLTGQIIPVLEDKKNHTIDSLRYLAEKLRVPVLNGALTW